MTDVVMPQMGESIVEGTLTKWLKAKGDRVERDEPLFEISTDKVDSEIPAPASGVLSEILVQEGETVAINTVVGRLSEGGNGAGPAAPAETKPAPARVEAPAAAREERGAPQPPPPPVALPSPVAREAVPSPSAPLPEPADEDAESAGPLSPLVRKMAREYNIDLRQVRGSGGGGRITKQDVEAFLGSRGAAPAPAIPPPAAPASGVPASSISASAPAPAALSTPSSMSPPARSEAPKSRIEPMSTMRQKIAEHMIFSKHTSAHVTTVHKVDMTKIVKLRSAIKGQFEGHYGFGLTYLPFVVRAACEGLRAFPIINASIDGKVIVHHSEINIGVAVALDGGNGLIVPVIRHADELNVVGLQRSIVDLAARARSKQLKPDDVQGGTFSVTNFGSYGSIFATPVINQPQSAILGLGAIEKLPVVVDGDAIAVRSQMHLALTFDHRLIDGALADQFCQKIKAVLQDWSEQVL